MVPRAPANRPPPSCWRSASGTRCSTPGAIYRTMALLRAARGDRLERRPGGGARWRTRWRSRSPSSGRGGTNQVFLRGADISTDIRTPEISDGASRVSALPEVRAALLDLQRRLGAAGGVVVEGRDIGTVVFPEAEAKFFLTATADERARRRVIELRAAGRTVDPAETLAEMRRARPPRQHARGRAAAQGRRRRRDRLERHGPRRRPVDRMVEVVTISRRLTRAAGVLIRGTERGSARRPPLGPAAGGPRRSLTFPNVDASFRAFAAPNGRGAVKTTPNPQLRALARQALARSEGRGPPHGFNDQTTPTTRTRRTSPHCSKRSLKHEDVKEGRHRQGHGHPGRQGPRRRRHWLQVRRHDPALRVHPGRRHGRRQGGRRRSTSSSRAARTRTASCVLSKEKADRLKVWDEISGACERDELIEGIISARVKGGLSVTIRGGVKAFLPGSQVDLRPVRNLDAFIGKTPPVQGHQVQQEARQHRAVAPRAAREGARRAQGPDAREARRKARSSRVSSRTSPSTARSSTSAASTASCTSPTCPGAASTTRRELFQVGDHVRVKVLKFNADTERVSLGLKQISEDPWTHAQEKYPPGTVVRGKVVSLKDYGAFIELEEGIEGLVHISEMSWTRRVKHPSQGGRRRRHRRGGRARHRPAPEPDLSLGMKQLEPNPYDALTREVPARHRRQGPGPQHRRLRHLRRDRGGHRRPGSHLAICRGPSA